MLTPVIYLIRHGKTLYNQKGLFRGEANIPLVEEGFKDAEEIKKFLEEVKPSFIVSSDKKRATQTANILAKGTDIEPTDTDQLRAWNLGKFSGQPKNEENLKELEKYINNPDESVPEGESLNEFKDRILPVLAECFEHAAKIGPGFVVAHSSVIHEVGTQLTGDHKSLVVKPGGVVAIGFDGHGNITAERIFKPLEHDESAASVS
jgi:broad specificity phosphatase PhoE